ncbi:MAG: exodeoxyribonuclease VII small subunit [Chloroflexi bacterium]|nr:MAG: exodeoxyribonuclease VII small subunit [Chloroflexota bacterium]
MDRACQDVFGRRGRAFCERNPGTGGGDRDLSQAPSLDDLLADLESTIAKLADGKAPLDELVAAHQRALRFLTEAQARLAQLRARADETAQLLSE